MHLHSDNEKKPQTNFNTNTNLKSALKKPSLDEFHKTIESLKQAKIALDNNNKLNVPKNKKHLRFNNQVEQRISVNVNPDDDYRYNPRFQHSALNEYLRSVAEEEDDDDDDDINFYDEVESTSDEDSEDDGLDKNKFKNLNRNYSIMKRKSIEITHKLPPTTLKGADDDSDCSSSQNNFSFEEYGQDFEITETTADPYYIETEENRLNYNDSNPKYVRLSTSSPAVYDYKESDVNERRPSNLRSHAIVDDDFDDDEIYELRETKRATFDEEVLDDTNLSAADLFGNNENKEEVSKIIPPKLTNSLIIESRTATTVESPIEVNSSFINNQDQDIISAIESNKNTKSNKASDMIHNLYSTVHYYSSLLNRRSKYFLFKNKNNIDSGIEENVEIVKDNDDGLKKEEEEENKKIIGRK
ncbi:hypothetical protein PIROE2DRAFT_13999 [Piromyces sp. E2]|nr:hypothetical protein PIROE2DRAFT_13999 [Piromyces sp. E2]|eukprot:OUM60283.1 hypothetical protein PIROE2DRAFT_13999 [Piromyces sp. E2]